MGELQGDEGGNVEVQKAVRNQDLRITPKYILVAGGGSSIWQQSVLHLQSFYENLYQSGKIFFFLKEIRNLFISFHCSVRKMLKDALLVPAKPSGCSNSFSSCF